MAIGESSCESVWSKRGGIVVIGEPRELSVEEGEAEGEESEGGSQEEGRAKEEGREGGEHGRRPLDNSSVGYQQNYAPFVPVGS